MTSKSKKKIRSITVGIVFVFTLVVAALTIAASLAVADHVRKEIATNRDNACSRIYENDLFQFEHPCDRSVLTDEDGKNIRILEFTRQGANEQYLLVDTLTESELTDWFGRYGGNFSDCESGDGFARWKMTVPAINGVSHEACLQGEHGGTTLFIRSNRPDGDYIVIGQGDGNLNDILPTLKVK
jgi:hypothetical protein